VEDEIQVVAPVAEIAETIPAEAQADAPRYAPSKPADELRTRADFTALFVIPPAYKVVSVAFVVVPFVNVRPPKVRTAEVLIPGAASERIKVEAEPFVAVFVIVTVGFAPVEPAGGAAAAQVVPFEVRSHVEVAVVEVLMGTKPRAV
jgi:hypothetical protein